MGVSLCPSSRKPHVLFAAWSLVPGVQPAPDSSAEGPAGDRVVGRLGKDGGELWPGLFWTMVRYRWVKKHTRKLVGKKPLVLGLMLRALFTQFPEPG